jgi:tetratricopeptide (TPR) repeat protein
MTKSKKKISDNPLTPEMMQMDNAKLFEYIKNQNFGSIEEINDFLNKNVIGKRIDEVVPLKKGRKSNKEKSDDLMYQAYDNDPVKGKKLAEEALKLNPENVRALNYLADCEENIEDAFKLYKQAVEIGAKQLGADFFKENKGHFWGMHETRPYMTAKLNYADCLDALGKTNESIKEFEEMLDLNPGDNQGVRYILASVLLRNKKYDAFYKLYKQNEDDNSAFWLFNYALFLFITEGASPKANKALYDAHQKNKNVIPLMTMKKKIKEDVPGYYSRGDENEATYYVMDNFHTWIDYPDALEWVFSFAETNKREE